MFRSVFPRNRHHQLHLNGNALKIRQTAGSLPDFGDADLRLLPVGVGHGAVQGRAAGQNRTVLIGVGNLIVFGPEGFPNEIDIPSALFIVGGQLEIPRQPGHRGLMKGNIRLRSLPRLIGQQNVLVDQRSVLTDDGAPVNDLGRLAGAVHLVNTRILLPLRDGVAPQGHHSVGPLARVFLGILPHHVRVKGRFAGSALDDGSAFVTTVRVIGKVAGAIVITGGVTLRRLGCHCVVVFPARAIKAGKVLNQHTPGVALVASRRLELLNKFITALCRAVQRQQQLTGPIAFPVAAVRPGNLSGKIHALAVGDGEAAIHCSGGKGVPVQRLRYNTVGKALLLPIHTGQTLIGALPLGRVIPECGELLNAKGFQSILRNLRPLLVRIRPLVHQGEVTPVQRRTVGIAAIYPGNRKGIGTVLHDIFGGDGHIGAFRNGALGVALLGDGGFLTTGFGCNLIVRVQLVVIHRGLCRHKMDSGRDRNGCGILVCRFFADDQRGLFRRHPAGVREGHLHGEFPGCLVSHHRGRKGQGLAFQRQFKGLLPAGGVGRIHRKEAAPIIGNTGLHRNGIGFYRFRLAALRRNLGGHVDNFKNAAALAVMGEQQIEWIRRQTVLGIEHRFS